MAKKRLGIDALFQTSVPSAVPAATSPTTDEVEVERLMPGSRQPRARFDETALAALAESIRAHGVLQPLLVRPSSDGRFEIVAGERRWRAAKAAGLARVPVRVRAVADSEVLAVAMVENLQREDLNPLEEAEGYIELLHHRLAGELPFVPYADEDDPHRGVVRFLRALNNRSAGNTKDNVVLSLEPLVAEVFGRVGRLTWPSFVAHRMPLLNLPDDVRTAVRTRALDYTKARLIARVTAGRVEGGDAHARRLRRDLIEQAATEGLSVRALQREVARALGALTGHGEVASGADPSSERSMDLKAKVEAARERLADFDAARYDPMRRAAIADALDALMLAL